MFFREQYAHVNLFFIPSIILFILLSTQYDMHPYTHALFFPCLSPLPQRAKGERLWKKKKIRHAHKGHIHRAMINSPSTHLSRIPHSLGCKDQKMPSGSIIISYRHLPSPPPPPQLLSSLPLHRGGAQLSPALAVRERSQKKSALHYIAAS